MGGTTLKYRKKPVVIEATQIMSYHDLEPACEWICANGGEAVAGQDFNNGPAYMYINTLEGTMKADIRDYIIQGVQGEFYPCKPDIFEMTYEKVEE